MCMYMYVCMYVYIYLYIYIHMCMDTKNIIVDLLLNSLTAGIIAQGEVVLYK